MNDHVFMAIDIGSNATKSKTWRIGPGTQTKQIGFKRYPLRLGAGAFGPGNISEEMIARLLDMLAEVRKKLDAGIVTTARAVATSAMRDASNGPAIRKRIHEATGIEISILEGGDEARLMALGAIGRNRDGNQQSVLIDIGGGSSEIIFARGSNVTAVRSLDLGAVRARQLYFEKHDPPLPDETAAAEAGIRAVIDGAFAPGAMNSSDAIKGMGLAGTITTLQRMAMHDDPSLAAADGLALERVEQLLEKIRPLNVGAIGERYPIEPDRADVIFAGGLILRELMRKLDLNKISVRLTGLADGLLAVYLEEASNA